MYYCQTINEFKEKLIPGKPLACLDYGTKKIGISVSNVTRSFAMPFKVLVKMNREKLIEEISSLIRDKKICGIVVGYPVENSGNEGEACKLVKNFIKTLINAPQLKGLVYFYQDERLSTKLAKTMLRDSGLKRKEKDSIDDQVAAMNILQTTLDLLQY